MSNQIKSRLRFISGGAEAIRRIHTELKSNRKIGGSVVSEPDGSITFQTSLVAPHSIIAQIALRHPGVEIEYEWADEELCRNCGRRNYGNGLCREIYTPDTDKEARELAASVWGLNLAEEGYLPDVRGTGYVCCNSEQFDMDVKATRKNRRSYSRVGAFVLSQPKMLVSDPCYEKGEFGTTEINSCKTGEWAASFNVNRYEWDIDGTLQRDERVAAIFVRHESIKSNSVFDGIFFKNGSIRYTQEWNLLSESVGVDSGQAGIFDASKYGDNGLFDAEGCCGFGDKWYSNCCDLTLEGHGGIVANMGVCAASGFGDGTYILWGHKDKDSQYDALVLFFLEDDDAIAE